MSVVVTIYGASDDLIETEGAIVAEFNDFDFRNGGYVYVSTGDVLWFRLEDEGWRAAVVVDATLPRVAYLDGDGGWAGDVGCGDDGRSGALSG